jgi:hypothetical protein
MNRFRPPKVDAVGAAGGALRESLLGQALAVDTKELVNEITLVYVIVREHADLVDGFAQQEAGANSWHK